MNTHKTATLVDLLPPFLELRFDFWTWTWWLQKKRFRANFQCHTIRSNITSITYHFPTFFHNYDCFSSTIYIVVFLFVKVLLKPFPQLLLEGSPCGCGRPCFAVKVKVLLPQSRLPRWTGVSCHRYIGFCWLFPPVSPFPLLLQTTCFIIYSLTCMGKMLGNDFHINHPRWGNCTM